MYSDPWFLGLPLTARGFFLQMIVLAKLQDNGGGVIRERGWVGWGSATGSEGKTARKMLGKFQAEKKIVLTEHSNGVIEAELINYEYWQEVKDIKQALKSGKKSGKSQEKVKKIPSQQNRAVQSSTEYKEKEELFVPQDNSETKLSSETIYSQLIFPIKGGEKKIWELPDDLFDEWEKLYPGMDIESQLKKALAWVRTNPTREKTAKGMPKFLLAWLNRAQNQGWMKPKRR